MRRLPVFLICGAAAVLAAADADAGGLFSRKRANSNSAAEAAQSPQSVDCSQLASVPNSGMTVEQCQAIMGMAQGAQAAVNDPSAARPGDERMSCADIQAEMRTMNVSTVSQEHRQAGEHAAQDLRSTLARQQAEATALGAKQSAEVTAAPDSGNDMTAAMQSNPRFACLVKLAMDRGCSGN